MTDQNTDGSAPEAERPTPHSSAANRRGRDREEARALIGQVIADKYKVLEILGHGGFGTVFLVEITAGMVGQKLALKLLPAELSASQKVREQFINEIRVAMRMVDRYIVQVRDVGTTEDGHLYYTMDYCPGLTLAEVIRENGPIDPQRAALITLKVLRALRTAHGAGIIHRDLKPANVMVHHEGDRETVRVLDFGIATALRSETQGKGVSGSPHYMPPEQFLGEKLGFYSDLYAIGAILYELVTGNRPYPGRTAKEVFLGLKQGPPPPPESVEPELAAHPGLLAVIRRALERNPERRYTDARDFFADLNTYVQGGEVAAATPAAAASGAAAPARAPRARSARRATVAAARARTARSSSPQSSAWALLAAIVVIGCAVVFVFREQLGLTSPGPNPIPYDGGPDVVYPDDPDPAPDDPTTGGGGTGPAVTDPTPDPDPPPEDVFDAVLVLREAQAALQREDWKTARSKATEVRVRENGNLDAARIIGLASLRLQDYENATRYLQGVRLKQTPPDLEVLLALAEAKKALPTPDWKDIEDILSTALTLPGADRKVLLPVIVEAILRQGGPKEEREKALRKLLAGCAPADLTDPRLQSLHRRLLVEEPMKLLKNAERDMGAAAEAFDSRDFAKSLEGATKVLAAVGEVHEYAPSPDTRKLRAQCLLLMVGAAVRNTEGNTGERPDLKHLYDSVNESTNAIADPEIAQSLGNEAEVLAVQAEYWRGRIDLLRFEAEGADTRRDTERLEQAEIRFTQLLGKAKEVRGAGGQDFVREVRSWRGRTYAYRGLYEQTDLDLKAASSIRDPISLFEQGLTYYIAAERTDSGASRSAALGKARGRFNQTARDSTASSRLKGSANDLLGRCYLRIASEQNDSERMLDYAARSFASANKEGLNSVRLFERWADAYERQGDMINWAKIIHKLYDEHPTTEHCIRAVDAYLRATGKKTMSCRLIKEGLERFEGSDRLKLQRRAAKLGCR